MKIKILTGDGIIHRGGGGGGLYTKIFIMHFYTQKAAPGLYTMPKTEDFQKFFILHLQPKMGGYTSVITVSKLQHTHPATETKEKH